MPNRRNVSHTIVLLTLILATAPVASSELDELLERIEALERSNARIERLVQETSLAPDVPAGTIVAYASTSKSIPPGWLSANGDPVSRDTYPKLYEVIGTIYDAGAEDGFFKLPDLDGYYALVWYEDEQLQEWIDLGKAIDPKRFDNDEPKERERLKELWTTMSEEQRAYNLTSLILSKHAIEGDTQMFQERLKERKKWEEEIIAERKRQSTMRNLRYLIKY